VGKSFCRHQTEGFVDGRMSEQLRLTIFRLDSARRSGKGDAIAHSKGCDLLSQSPAKFPLADDT
jgi:hypothetical protein